MTGKGREGLRFGRRVWEEQANIGRTGELRVRASMRKQAVFHISKEGPKLFAFLTGKGREGLRFGRRVWEEQANIVAEAAGGGV